MNLINFSYFIGLLFIIIVASTKATEKQEYIIAQNDTIIEMLNHRTYLDSVYAEHIGTCSFVSREDLAFDSRGYVYDVRKTSTGWLTDYKPKR